MRRNGILLFSGGLDSLLAAKLLIEQKIEITALHFLLPFTPPDCELKSLKISELAEEMGLKLKIIRCGRDYMEMVKNPPHGYGKNLNPCIDCKIYFLKKAREVMEKEKASFVATGEVVGQRPMSQTKHMLNHIEKESGLKGNLLRPLSAKTLNPTIAETEKIVDRDAFLAISGRSRSIQIELARKYNITDYESPAGGCLLTDKNIAARVKDLLDHHPDYNITEIYLLTIGRHYRINNKTKVIISRNEKENAELIKHRDIPDYFIEPDFKGPCIHVKGNLNDSDITLIGQIAARYGKVNDEENKITIFSDSTLYKTISVSDPVSDKVLDKIRI